MSERFVCERCGQAFESAEARCPKCLRKSSVREASERASSPEALRLASGDRTQTSEGRRASALIVAIAGSAALAALLMLAWVQLERLSVLVPALIACTIAALAWIRAALTEGNEAARPWAAFALRCAVGLGLGAWAFVAGVIAIATTAGLSNAFTAAIGGLLFVGGVIPVLRWMKRAEEAPTRPPGKWR